MEPPIAEEARLESVLQVAVELVRMIDLAAREIVALEEAEIALGVETLAAVLGGAPSETVLVTTPEVPAQVAAGVLKALAVRVGAMAEPAVEVSVAAVAVAAVAVVVVAVVAGGGR